MKKTLGIFIFVFVFLGCALRAEEKTVFLTGSCGFIGSNFLSWMFDKHPDYKFIVLDALTYAGSLENIPSKIQLSNRFEFIHGSVVDLPLVNEIMSRADYVVHFAAETHVTRSIYDDYPFFETDVMGTRSMMRALLNNRERVQRFVHISTSEVYGTAESAVIDEKHLLKPRSPYAAAKAAADRLVFAYNCTYDLPTVTVRPFNNFGPRQHPEKMLPRFICSAIKGEPLTVHGDGLQSRDWIYVEDVCEALDRLLHVENFETVKHQEINIGTGKATSVLEIARLICESFDLPDSHLKFVGDRPGQVECHIAGTQKAKDLIGWSSKTALEEGLKRTIQWYLDHYSFCEKRAADAVIPIQTRDGTTENQ